MSIDLTYEFLEKLVDRKCAFGDVKLERRLELAYEGHYLWDLGRWGDSVERTDFTGNASFKDFAFPSYKWALPIPQSQIDINPNLEQNPGY